MLAPAERWKLLDLKPPAPGWKEDLADGIERAIKDANNGDWPVTEKQLRKVAAQFGKHLDISSEYPFPGLLVDDVIATTSQEGAVHELAHAVIEHGGFPEWQTPGDKLLPHQIAVIVEHRYARYMLFIRAARAEESYRRERTRSKDAAQIEIRYEVDEYADAPFSDG